MTTLNFAPLYRSTVGFDHMAALLDKVSTNERGQSSYPPYDIELLAQDKYQITMAVAGFAEQELVITSENNMLTVAAVKTDKKTDVKALTAEVMKQLDSSSDGKVTKDEFVKGLLANYSLR